MGFKLSVAMTGSGEASPSEYRFDKDEVTIGREPENDIVLSEADKRVSARHARLMRGEQGYSLCDLGSTNGTLLNGERITPQAPAALRNGDNLTIGPFQIRFSTGEESAAIPAAAGAAGDGSLEQAGLDALRRMSAKFLGDEGFHSPQDVERFGILISQALELTLDWLARSLQGRSNFESQFSADLTMIFAKEQNPLKTSKKQEEMARLLLDWRDRRDVGVIRTSLDDAFKDLTMHQIGLLAGVQESLRAVLHRLDPKSIEAEAKQKGGFFSSTAGRAWERYAELYREIFAENSRFFNEMIYPNVRKGYLLTHSDQPEAVP